MFSGGEGYGRVAQSLGMALTRNGEGVETAVMRGFSSPLRRDDGLTLIELLIVMLIIGVLAAIAIPSFLDQQGKASDTTAKEVARTASLAAETFSTEHSASYSGISPAVLQEYDHSLQIAEGNHNAYLQTAEEAESGKGYVVTAVAPQSKDTFTITRNGSGELKRTCSSAAKAGGCRTGTW